MKNLGLGIATALGLSLSACVTINGTPMGVVIDGADSGNVVTQYPIETAMLNIYTKPRTEQLRAVIDNRNVVADITVIPKGAMVFNGKQVQGAEVNTITKINNQITNQSVAINYYTPNPLRFYGFTDSLGEYSVAEQTSVIPKLAKVGAGGLLLTENVYSDSSKRQKTAMYYQNWSLKPDSISTAQFCIETSANLLLVTPDGTTSECYRINPQGDILSSTVSINELTANGMETITFVSQ